MVKPLDTSPSRPGRPAAFRLWQIHLLIKTGQCPSVPELARRLEVSPRTIERDLAYLRDVFGAPLHFDRAKNRYVYTEPTFELPPVPLTESEIAALLITTQLLQKHMDSPLAPMIQRVLERLTRLFPEEVMVQFSDLEEALLFGPSHGLEDPHALSPLIQDILQAIRAKTTLLLSYHSASRREITRRHVDPYYLYFARSTWYLLGYCHLRKDLRLFALQRIRHLEITHRRFSVPKDFDATRLLQNIWQSFRGDSGAPEKVILHFSPDVAPQIQERRWHSTQVLEPLPDGGCRLQFHVAVTPELEGWIAQSG
ncbi:MAG: WYL domain-containing protein [Clostridiales bacterium]|nr:WYL domain-containing protein [Clostridiales bacterium]